MKASLPFIAAMLGLASVTAVTAANASPPNEQGFYLGALASRVNYKESDVNNVSLTALALQGGWQFNHYFAVEARLGKGVGSASVNSRTPTGGQPAVLANLKLSNYFSLLVRGSWPVSDQFNLYGLLGETQGKLEAQTPYVTASTSDTKPTYAVGAEYRPGAARAGVGLEYGRLFSGGGYDVDAVSLVYRYRF
jgi:hypothetical protein